MLCRALNNTINLRTLNSTHFPMLHPQNGDRVVAIDSDVTLLYVYNSCTGIL